MDYVYYIYNNVKYFYNSMNPATLSGAIDVIVVEQPDGSLLSTPFHVRFGKYGVFNYENKYVDIEINGEEIDLKMKLGENGVAFFMEPDEADQQQNHDPKQLINHQLEPESKSQDPHTDELDARKESSSSNFADELATKKEKSTPSLPSTMKTPRMSTISQQNQLKAAQPRQRLAFSSSIYSCRRNRSLPDLASLASLDSKDARQYQDGRSETAKRTGKLSLFGRLKEHSQHLKHSSSASTALKNFESPTAAELKGAAKLQQIDFDETKKDEEEDDDGIEMKNCPGPSSSNDIADGALSDSEVERHRSSPHIKDPEWKWGEIPKSEENKNASENGQIKTSRWNYWFGRWSSRRQKEEEKGISLQEIGKDPDKLGVYIGAGSLKEPSRIPPNISDSEQVPSPDTNAEPLVNSSVEFSRDSPSPSTSMDVDVVVAETIKSEVFKKYSLRLSNEQLRLLKLNYGSNEARFSITTKYQGTAWCSCHIYLLHYSDKLVISDIDGTITKSDVLGHVIPAIGGTWAHSGVAELYTRIKHNGYQMVYLSSRAIGQSHYTKTYLQNFAQGSRTLPDGPVLLSPSSVLMAFRKEVIERKPEEFKIACLNDLNSLFPAGQRPFFVGFGNRETDVTSYRAVGIPSERIMIIDPQGRLRRADNKVGGYVSDYAAMAMNIVDYVFPPRKSHTDIPLREKESVSEFLSWRADPQHFDNLVDEELKAYRERTSNNVCMNNNVRKKHSTK